MKKKDIKIDSYISKSQDFAKPILTHFRKIVHKAVPKVEENIKWGFPNFDYKGPFCGMAAFKQHCSFGLWKASLINDKYNILQTKDRTAMGNFGKVRSLNDLPDDKILIEYLKEAAKLNDKGIKLEKKKTHNVKKELEIPEYFINLLKKNKKALATFTAFSYSHKKEYVEWITEAKTEETRNKRIATTIEWLTEGKSRNWKYVKK